MNEKIDQWLLPSAILLGALLVSGSILYSGSAGSANVLGAVQDRPAATAAPEPLKNPEDLVVPHSPVLGAANAPVTIVEFSDFQCPYCRAFWRDAYAQIKKNYIDTGKARLVYRDYPLSFHPAARPAALAGHCAQEQGKFWQFHDIVYQQQEKQGQGTISFGETDLKAWARLAGVNGAQFDSCLTSKKYDKNVDADMEAATAAGVSGTPTFYVNGQKLVGAQPFEKFKQAIDAALKK